jgi:hypothetical protein
LRIPCASLTVAALLIAAIGPAASRADLLDNFPEATYVSSFGEPFSPYFAQTFVAPTGAIDALAIRFYGDYDGAGEDAEFHLLITEVEGSGIAFHPTTIVYESGFLSLDSSAPPFATGHIPLPDLVLVPGVTYAFVLDAFVTRDGDDGTIRVGTNGTYAGGAFYWNQAFDGTTREEHFASEWESAAQTPHQDLAFQLYFVPEPSPALLLVTGLLGFGLRGRRSDGRSARRAGYRAASDSMKSST